MWVIKISTAFLLQLNIVVKQHNHFLNKLPSENTGEQDFLQ